jgi:hypothetical protein
LKDELSDLHNKMNEATDEVQKLKDEMVEKTTDH